MPAYQDVYLQSVLDCVSSGVMAFRAIRDRHGNIVDFEWSLVNPQAERMVGRSASDLLGKRLLEEMPGNRQDGLFDLYVMVVETGKMLDHEHYYEHENLKTWFRTRAIKLEDGFVVSFDDITAYKNALASAETERREHETLFNQTHDAVFNLDLEGRHIRANKRATEMLGYSLQEFKQTTVYDISAQNEQSTQVLKRLLAGDAIAPYERILRKRDGSTLHVEISAELIRDEHGKPLYIQSVVRDISERKNAEQALRDSEERYRHITELMSDYAIYTRLNATGELETGWITGRFEAIMGYDPQEFSRTLLPENMPEDAYQRMMQDINSTLEGHPTQGEYRIKRKDGRLVWLSISRVPVLDASKEHIIGFYSVGKDISERKQAQQREFDLRLERERTQLLMRFIQDASHEFRTPLSVINTSLYIMEHMHDAETVTRKTQKIKDQVTIITELIDALLLMVRLETKGLDVKKPINIVQTLAVLVDTCQVAGTCALLHFEAPAYPITLSADENALKEALKRILDNACRYPRRWAYQPLYSA